MSELPGMWDESDLQGGEADCAEDLLIVRKLKEENAALKGRIDELLAGDHAMLEEMNATKTALAAAEARIAELEGERDDDRLLNKYAVCLNGAVTQHIYSRVNRDAQSVYERLVGLHHYNPDISVHFVACKVEPNE